MSRQRFIKLHRKRGERGLTLLEVLIACLILAILASVAIPKYQDLRESATQESEEYMMTVIRNGIELYRTGMMPSS